jgi:hypothetical protein
LANVGESGESEQTRLANVGEFSESDQFSKKAILASTRIRQKWQIFGEYSTSTNSLSSGHCLQKTQLNWQILEQVEAISFNLNFILFFEMQIKESDVFLW